MKIVKGKEQEYKDWYEKNSDPYGRACFTYAERWAGMMEEKIEASEDDEMKVIVDNATQLSYEADEENHRIYVRNSCQYSFSMLGIRRMSKKMAQQRIWI